MRIATRRCAGWMTIMACLFMLTGCTYTTQRSPGLGLYGLAMEELCRQDYEILDTVEGKGEVTQILWFITIGDSEYGYVGNEGLSSPGLVQSLSSLFTGRARNADAAAVHDALSKLPEADTILPLTKTNTTNGVPGIFSGLYSTQTATVRGKGLRVLPGTGKNCRVRTQIKTM